VKTDVTDYESVLKLFDTAWKKYGKVDIAISNAGIQEVGSLFDPGLGLESVKTVGSPLPFVFLCRFSFKSYERLDS
jgi:NAD(P)-dependent dehydrogenase (short-subunit alcohol dehydrogenase family)